MVGMLGRERLVAALELRQRSYSTFSTRRLRFGLGRLLRGRRDVAEELMGPSAKIAFKEGVATPAAVAFAKKAGVAVEALKTVSTPKGRYLAAITVKAGAWGIGGADCGGSSAGKGWREDLLGRRICAGGRGSRSVL